MFNFRIEVVTIIFGYGVDPSTGGLKAESKVGWTILPATTNNLYYSVDLMAFYYMTPKARDADGLFCW